MLRVAFTLSSLVAFLAFSALSAFALTARRLRLFVRVAVIGTWPLLANVASVVGRAAVALRHRRCPIKILAVVPTRYIDGDEWFDAASRSGRAAREGLAGVADQRLEDLLGVHATRR